MGISTPNQHGSPTEVCLVSGDVFIPASTKSANCISMTRNAFRHLLQFDGIHQIFTYSPNSVSPSITRATLEEKRIRILLAGHDHQQIAGIGAKTHIRICILADDKFIVLNRGIPFEVNVTHMNAQPATFEKLQLPIGQRLTKLPAQDLLQNPALQRKGVNQQRRTKLY